MRNRFHEPRSDTPSPRRLDDVNANKSLYGNERETPSIRSTRFRRPTAWATAADAGLGLRAARPVRPDVKLRAQPERRALSREADGVRALRCTGKLAAPAALSRALPRRPSPARRYSHPPGYPHPSQDRG
jgi:hypothetical protein